MHILTGHCPYAARVEIVCLAWDVLWSVVLCLAVPCVARSIVCHHLVLCALYAHEVAGTSLRRHTWKIKVLYHRKPGLLAVLCGDLAFYVSGACWQSCACCFLPIVMSVVHVLMSG